MNLLICFHLRDIAGINSCCLLVTPKSARNGRFKSRKRFFSRLCPADGTSRNYWGLLLNSEDLPFLLYSSWASSVNDNKCAFLNDAGNKSLMRATPSANGRFLVMSRVLYR